MSEINTTLSTFIWPCLGYVDAPAAIRFLTEAFGFETTARHHGITEDIVEHAELRWPGGGGVMLGSARHGSTLSELPAGVGAVYIVTDDPDGLFARAVSAGATVVKELTGEDYGSRGFTVRDPEGVFWSFGTYAGTS